MRGPYIQGPPGRTVQLFELGGLALIAVGVVGFASDPSITLAPSMADAARGSPRPAASLLGVAPRTIRRWAAAYRQRGEAGLASARFPHASQVDPRGAKRLIMREHTRVETLEGVIYQISKRLEICFGKGVVPEPSRATAYRELKRLEAQHRTFTGTTARNRDIARRPKRPYGKLQPTRPG